MHVLHRLIHHVHGSGTIYGFASLSEAAQPIDRLVDWLATREMPPAVSEAIELATRVDALRAAINHVILPLRTWQASHNLKWLSWLVSMMYSAC
jgi:chemotaxis protein histidine kinase CheA